MSVCLTDFARRAVSLFWKASIILPLFCGAANAQTRAHPRWALHWYADSGDSYIDRPVCGPLQKFTGNPKPFDYGKELWRIKDQDFMDDVKTDRVGEISGFTVYNVIHTIVYQFAEEGQEPEWALPEYLTMILVERQPGEFCEIHQEQLFGYHEDVTPAYFIDAGEKVLATSHALGGSAGLRREEYWTCDKDGPVPLDLNQIPGMAEALLPSGYSFYSIPYFFESGPTDVAGLPLQMLSFRSMACTNWNGNHPDRLCGFVRMDFEVKDHKLIATRKEFVPAP